MWRENIESYSFSIPVVDDARIEFPGNTGPAEDATGVPWLPAFVPVARALFITLHCQRYAAGACCS